MLDKEFLHKVKKGALLVSVAHKGVIDEPALYESMQSGRFRAAIDHPLDTTFADIPDTRLYYSNNMTAYATFAGRDLTSNTAVNVLLELLDNKGAKL